MHVGVFSEDPWQHSSWKEEWGTGALTVSNRNYDPSVATQLLNRYIDEKVYAEEVGFDILMKNEHHSAPFCMQGVTNVGAAILARETRRAKIFLGGNILPLWDDPLWLAESLAFIDNISDGRLVPGWVRGVGSESYSHNSNPAYNRERFEEAHDFIVKTWTTPGPFRWEGKHYNYRYVNPWAVPTQKPHPPMWIPGTTGAETVTWAAQHRYPYIRLSAGPLESSRDMFDLYHQTARELGYESGPEHVGYLIWVHVEDTDEKALEVGKKLAQGVRSPFDPTTPSGTAGTFLPGLPGLTSKSTRQRLAALRMTAGTGRVAGQTPTGRPVGPGTSWEDMLGALAAVAGNPKTVIEKLRRVLEFLRPGILIFRTGDGAFSHEDTMRTFKLMGAEVIPALKEIGDELDLPGPFEKDPATGERRAFDA
jgi:alkanesulfonate monooxygenase SsuD/methylene tetrahydromethanopterin reductase-like flavin-dependent oxidoreductase (luciferase family)